MVKPDGVQRSLVGQIISRFEQRGYALVAMKMVRPNEEHFRKHYADLTGLSFFPKLLKYMMMGPVVAMVWQGTDVVKQGRSMLGATRPLGVELPRAFQTVNTVEAVVRIIDLYWSDKLASRRSRRGEDDGGYRKRKEG